MVAPLTPLGTIGGATDQRQALKRSRDRAEEYTAMLVRDWLERSALRTTVQTFDEECARLDKRVPGAPEWVRLVELLQAACLTGARRDSVAVKTRPATPLLRLLVESQLEEQAPRPTTSSTLRLPRKQSTIVMTKRTAARDGLRVPNQRELPQATPEEAGRTPKGGDHARTATISSPSPLRPKSAMVCKSMADLISRTSEACARPRPDEPPSAVGLQKLPRPISAASALVNRGGLSFANKASTTKASPSSADTPETPSPQTEKIVRVASLKSVALPSARHSNTVSAASLPQVSEANTPAADDDYAEDQAQEAEPALLLEEMSEELLMSQFSSLSKEAIKTIRRVRAKSNACNQEFEKAKRTIDKIQAREKQRQARRIVAAEQTELLSSTMDGLTNESCALCQHVFPKKSLVMKVTYKAIFDLRASWATTLKAKSLPVDPAGLRTDTPATNDGDLEDRSQIAHFYDEVPICAFCKQLVLNVSLYRPSSAETRSKRAETSKAAAEALQLKETERLRALNRCDPLDFHLYELNSDEDDSDMEEVLECGADGRQRIVRRKRLQNLKVVANRGLVGKHLHYDMLRSQSVHALNNKEWQQITS